MAVAVGPLLKPLHRRQKRPARPAGRPDHPGRRHRRRACGCCAASAARRSSPTATASESQRVRHAGVGVARSSRCSRRPDPAARRCFVALVTWLGAPFAVARRDHRRRAGRLLRLRRVPGRAAAHAHRGRRQADPGARRRPPGGAHPGAASPRSDRRHRAARAAACLRRPELRAWPSGPACSPRRRGRARGRRRDRRPARPLHRRATSTFGGVPLRDAARSTRCARRDPGRRQRRPAVRRPRCATSSTSRGTADGRAAPARRCTRPCAEDIVEALPDGLDARVAERGPGVLRRPAAAAPAGPGAARRPGGADPGRADQRRRRPHRGPHRRPAGQGPRRPDHGGLHHQPAGARPRRPRGLRRRTAGSRAEGTHRELLATAPGYAADRDPGGGLT